MFAQSIKTILTAGLIATTVAGTAIAGDKVKIRMQSAYGGGLPALGETAKYFTEKVNVISSGSVNVKFYDPKKLVPTLQIFDAVKAGNIDAGYSWPGMWLGKIPALAVFGGVPFGPEATDYLAWLYHGGGLELWREVYAAQGVVPVPCGILAPEAAGWFKNEIKSTDDFKGMKIRFGGLGGEVMKRLGASVTMLGGADVLPNLERGTIDATEFSMPAIDQKLGFYKVIQNYYFPGWHQPSAMLEFIVNKSKWDSMTELQRKNIEAACEASILWGLTKGIADQPKALSFMKDKGVNVHVYSDEMIQKFKETTDQVIKESLEKDPLFKKVFDSMDTFMASTAEWRGMAYAR